MSQIAFSTLACPTWDWERVVREGAAYGYDGVEVRQIAGETDLLGVPSFRPSRRTASLALLKECGPSARNGSFVVCGLASSVRFDYPDQADRDAQLRIGRAYVELAAELEAGFVRVFGDVLPDRSQPAARSKTLAQIAEGLNRLGEFAARYRVDVLLETHGDFSDSTSVRELFQQVESPRVGVLWDTHHPWRFCHESPESTLLNLGPWLRHTHWKDSVTLPAESADGSVSGAVFGAGSALSPAEQQAHALMSGHRHADYVLFGDGEFPIATFVQRLKGAGYDGWLSLEWEKMWHPELADPEAALPFFPPKMRDFWSR